jgi:hypothetical protein
VLDTVLYNREAVLLHHKNHQAHKEDLQVDHHHNNKQANKQIKPNQTNSYQLAS